MLTLYCSIEEVLDLMDYCSINKFKFSFSDIKDYDEFLKMKVFFNKIRRENLLIYIDFINKKYGGYDFVAENSKYILYKQSPHVRKRKLKKLNYGII